MVVFFSYSFSRGSVFDKIDEEDEEEEDGEEDADGESFKTDIEVDDRTYSVGNDSSLNEGLRSRVRKLLSKHLQVDHAAQSLICCCQFKSCCGLKQSFFSLRSLCLHQAINSNLGTQILDRLNCEPSC